MDKMMILLSNYVAAILVQNGVFPAPRNHQEAEALVKNCGAGFLDFLGQAEERELLETICKELEAANSRLSTLN